jgi:signal peptidase
VKKLKALIKMKRPTLNVFLILVFFTPAVASFYLGIQPHVVSTGSMKPNINPGDLIFTKFSKAMEINEGDVILLFDNSNNSTKAHRVIKVLHQEGVSQITTKGDSNPLPDITISEPSNMPVQEVEFIIGNAGYVLEATHSTEAKFLFGGVILFVILVRGVSNSRSNKEKLGKSITSINQES